MSRCLVFVAIVALLCGSANALEIDVAKLTKDLQSPVSAARIEAAKALGEADADSLPKATIAVLARATLDRDPAVRRAVVQTIRKLKIDDDVFLPIIVKVLKQSDPATVMPALQTLAEDGKAAVPGLVRALKDEEACYWACIVLAEIGADAKDAAPHIVQVLKHKMPECRMQALEALGKIGPGAKSAAAEVAKALDDDYNGVRYTALFALGKMGVADALPKIKKAVKSEDPIEKLLAAWAQLQLDSGNEASVEESIKIILAGLNSENPTVRSVAVEAIQESEAPTEKVAPALIKALEAGDEEFVDNIVSAMASRGPKVAERIGRGLANPKLRKFAVMVVVRMGPDAESLVPQLVKLLEDDDAEFRREVQFALGRIGPAAAPAVEALTAALDSDSLELQHSAAYALGQIGPKAKSAAAKLREKLKSEDEFMRVASVWALLEIQPNAKRLLARGAVPLLTKALGDEREMVRVEVAKSLGNLGAAAAPAKDALSKLAEGDASLLVRATAAEALRKIN